VILERLSETIPIDGNRQNGLQHPIDTDAVSEDRADLGHTEPVDEPDWFAELRTNREDIVRSAQIGGKAFESGRNRVQYRLRKERIAHYVAMYWLNLIDTAQII